MTSCSARVQPPFVTYLELSWNTTNNRESFVIWRGCESVFQPKWLTYCLKLTHSFGFKRQTLFLHNNVCSSYTDQYNIQIYLVNLLSKGPTFKDLFSTLLNLPVLLPISPTLLKDQEDNLIFSSEEWEKANSCSAFTQLQFNDILIHFNCYSNVTWQCRENWGHHSLCYRFLDPATIDLIPNMSLGTTP